MDVSGRIAINGGTMNFFVEILIWIAYLLSLYFSVFLLLVYLDKRSSIKIERSDTNPPHLPLVSIIIPAYNEEKTILKTLQSVEELDYPKEKMEVIVVNDGSKDNTKIIIEQFIAGKKYFRVRSHENRGKAASLNRALQEVQGEFFACLDADSFVHPLTLRKMLSLYYKENNADIAIITPAMKVANPKNILQKVQWLEYIVIIFVARLAALLDSLYVAPGPFSLYRTAIIKELGGFDEKNITEDQEIAYRVQKHHYRIKQSFDGYVYTTAPSKFKPFYRQRRRWYLGSLLCLHKYKEMIANRRYGDFGMLQTIKNIAGYFLAITGITVAIYLFYIPIKNWIANLLAIKFEVMPYIVNFQFKFNFMNFLLADFKKMFVVLFLFIISFSFFYLAHKNAREKMTAFGWVPLLPYFVFYYLFKGVILLISLIEFSRGKKLRW